MEPQQYYPEEQQRTDSERQQAHHDREYVQPMRCPLAGTRGGRRYTGSAGCWWC